MTDRYDALFVLLTVILAVDLAEPLHSTLHGMLRAVTILAWCIYTPWWLRRRRW